LIQIALQFFSALTIKDMVETLTMSPTSVKSTWMNARGWLYEEIDRGIKEVIVEYCLYHRRRGAQNTLLA